MPVVNPQSVTLHDLIRTKIIVKRLVEMGIPTHFDTVPDDRCEITVSSAHLHELKALMMPGHISWDSVPIDRVIRRIQSSIEVECDDADAIRELCLMHYPDTGGPRLVQAIVNLDEDEVQLGFDATPTVPSTEKKKAKKKKAG